MNDSNERFARLVLLCSKSLARNYPTMDDVEHVAVALTLRRRGWLRHHGFTPDSAREFIGEPYYRVIPRVRQTLNNDA